MEVPPPGLSRAIPLGLSRGSAVEYILPCWLELFSNYCVYVAVNLAQVLVLNRQALDEDRSVQYVKHEVSDRDNVYPNGRLRA